MKYVAPTFEKTVAEAKDILTASLNGFEIEKIDEGKGNIQLDFSQLLD